MLDLPQYSSYIYTSPDVNLAYTALGGCRGKMIIVMDYSYDIAPTDGRFRYHDGFVGDDPKTAVCAYRGMNMTVCDLYADTDDYTKMYNFETERWNTYAGFGKEYLYLVSWTLTAGATGSIRDLAAIANNNLPTVLYQQLEVLGKGKPNIVYIDFVNVNTTRSIIAHNF